MNVERFIFDAIRALCPDAEFSILNYDASDIRWIQTPEDFAPPTEDEVMEKAEDLRQEHLSKTENLESSRQSAINKLSALGLTVDEISAAFGLGDGY